MICTELENIKLSFFLKTPSASAYVTYSKADEALKAIQTVNNVQIDNRVLKASLGTTKYCSHFLKGIQCPKADCMYLHDLGEDNASFTKEQMSQGLVILFLVFLLIALD